MKSQLNSILKCLSCGSEGLDHVGSNLFCANPECKVYKIPLKGINGIPIIIDFENSICSDNNFDFSTGKSEVNRRNSFIISFLKYLTSKKNRINEKNIVHILDHLSTLVNPKILIVGGGEIGNGLESLYRIHSNNLYSFDIYYSKHIDIIADAHQIPLKSGYFDLVIIQAVLEHVLEPNLVVSEIYRVLKTEGIIYAETPFMQQVHEGAFDFTRFTDSGHRFLFKRFELINSGYLQGVGTSLLWSLSYFFSGLFRSNYFGKITRILFFWITYFDSLIPPSYNVDGACGVYFLGRKSNYSLKSNEIIEYYRGSQH